MGKIDQSSIINRYKSVDNIWDPNDKWHLVTNRMIKDFIKTFTSQLNNTTPQVILNAGSAGNNYEIKNNEMFHIDLVYKQRKSCEKFIIGSVERIPIKNKIFDLILCVGSVLNYCDPFLVISEFERTIKDDGFLILEFENSLTFELFGKSNFNKGVTLVDTFYNGNKEKLWYFSNRLILNLTTSYSFKLIANRNCHILSPLIYRLTKNSNFAARFASFDRICTFIPIVNKFSSNSILLLKKQ